MTQPFLVQATGLRCYRRDPPGPGPVARLLDLGAVHPLGLGRRFHLRAEATWSKPAVDNVHAYIYISIYIYIYICVCKVICMYVVLYIIQHMYIYLYMHIQLCIYTIEYTII